MFYVPKSDLGESFDLQWHQQPSQQQQTQKQIALDADVAMFDAAVELEEDKQWNR